METFTAFSIPHPFPYQGSKRGIAKIILPHFPTDVQYGSARRILTGSYPQRQREGIGWPNDAAHIVIGAGTVGRRHCECKIAVAAGDKKVRIAHDLGISRETLY